MKEVFRNLWVGSEDDVAKAESKDMAILSACKDGKTSHRGLLGYQNMGAPKSSSEYLVARRPNHLYLNLIDGEDPSFVPDKLIDAALSFITEHLGKNKPVFIHCVEGRSRSASLALLWMYLNGKLPSDYHRAVKTFRTLYPDYDPANGIRQYVKDRISAAKHRR